MPQISVLGLKEIYLHTFFFLQCNAISNKRKEKRNTYRGHFSGEYMYDIIISFSFYLSNLIRVYIVFDTNISLFTFQCWSIKHMRRIII